MNALFAGLGAILGLLLGRWPSTAAMVVISLCCLPVTIWSVRKGALPWFASGLLIGLLFALIAYRLPLEEGATEIEAIVIRKSDDYVIAQRWFSRYYVYAKGNSFEVGDVLRISGKAVAYERASYESRFDFGEYLLNLGVRQEIVGAKFAEVFSTPIRLRSWETSFLSGLSDEAKALLDSLLFGKKDYGSSVIAKADSLNLLFLLSASGLFYSGFLRLLETVAGWKWKEGAPYVALGVGLFFLPFSLHKVGILRAFLVRLLRLAGRKWDVDYLLALSLSALFLLSLDFHLAYDTGFLIGYGLCLFLYAGRNALKHLSTIREKLHGMAFIRVFLLPMGLSSGGAIHVLGIPFLFVLLPLSVVTLALGWVSFFIHVPFVPVFNGLASAIDGTLSFFDAIDLAIPLPAMAVGTVAVFYFVLAFVLFCLEIRAKRIAFGVSAAAIGLYVVSLAPIVPALTQSVSFVNVGQGDCTLIQHGMNAVMVDTGGQIGFDMATESLIPYLRKRRIYRLDAVIATHQDYDHMGAVESLRSHFPVGAYLTKREEFPYRVGEIALTNYNVYDGDGENDSSLVLGLSLLGRSWLIMGDAPAWVERKIVEDHPSLDCDVLKVGHHGSNTSTCDEFLDAVTPSVAVISCGKKNKYGHPTKQVLSRLRARKIAIRRTDEEGTIEYRSIVSVRNAKSSKFLFP